MVVKGFGIQGFEVPQEKGLNHCFRTSRFGCQGLGCRVWGGCVRNVQEADGQRFQSFTFGWLEVMGFQASRDLEP